MLWKLLKFIALLLKTAFWLLLLASLAGLLALYILERGIPAPLVRQAEERLSSEDYLCRIGRATYSLKSGLHVYHVKAFPKRVADTALLSADEIAADIDLRPRLALSERLRGVTVRGLTVPPRPRNAAPPEPQPIPPPPALPTLAAFPVVIEQASIYGVQTEQVSATLAVAGPRLSATQIVIRWPDKAFKMTVEGAATLDFASREVSCNIKGQTFPANLMPLFEALRASGVIRQINCFSQLDRPVIAEAALTINIDNSDFQLILGLDVGQCAYRDVPMKFAKGTILAYGTNIYTTVDVGPVEALSESGPLSGRLIYREETESLEVDASSAMALDHLVQVINILNHGELKPLRCDTPPRIRARGIMALDSVKSTVTNTLSGTLAFEKGALFNLDVRDITADLAIDGYTARIDNVSGTSASGGPLAGNVRFTFPNYSATNTRFTAAAKLTDVDLADLSRVFNVTNARVGLVTGSFTVQGRASDHTIPSLEGAGQLSIRNGLLHRMPLFAGFTDYLAANIPGVSSLVNQSAGSMDFTIREGVLRTDNLLVEGDLFSITGKGSCNLENEALDFLIRANIFREKTFAGRLSRLVTLPFTRLLLEFKVFGTLNATDWSYVNIIERITGSLSEISGARKTEPPQAEGVEPPLPPAP